MSSIEPTRFIVSPKRLRRPFLSLALVLGSAILGMWLSMPWSAAVLEQSAAARSSDTSSQAGYVLDHPFKALTVVVTDLVIHAPRYLSHFIGRLGLLDTPLPLPLLGVWLIALAGAALASDGAPRHWQRAVAAGVFVLLCLGITFALYAAWSPVGASYVEGVQGRYFIPIAPMIFLVAANRKFRWTESRWWAPAFVAFHIAGLAVVLAVLMNRYYR